MTREAWFQGAALVLLGEVDAAVARQLEFELAQVVPGVVLVDLRAVTLLSVSGARLLVECARTSAEREVVLRAVVVANSIVARVLRLVDRGVLLPQFVDEHAAVAVE